MAKQKIKQKTDQRPFVMVYHDFLKSGLLDNHYQIVIYIFLKMFADNNNQCYPSAKKLSKLTKIGITKVKNTINELEEKHIITKQNRVRIDGGKSSNLYTIHDFKELWNTNSNEEVAIVINEMEEQQMIETLIAKGYYISKEKGLESVSDQTAESSTQKKHNIYNKENTTTKLESQDLEKYTIDQIHQLFEYDIMVLNYPLQQKDIDSVMDILYTAINTTKPVIKIAGEDKPVMTVISKLMKLHRESIMYAIKKFSEQTERIKNPTAYMLTILYNAPEQFNLDIKNQVSHDMANWNKLDKQ